VEQQKAPALVFVMSRARQIKDALAWLHHVTSCFRRDATKGQETHEVFIFCYHRINTRECSPLGVDLEVFRQQLELFASAGTLLSPEDFFQFLDGEKRLPSSKNFLVTFDDGYVSTADAAFPALQAAGARAISFIATDHLGKTSPYPPDRHTSDKERTLTLGEVRDTQSVYLYQSHGHRHIDYFHSTRESVLADLSTSLQWFARELGYRPCSIAYPFGLAPRWTNWQANLRQAGIRIGFATGSHALKMRMNTSAGLPLLSLPRIGYLTDETLAHTRARLTGGLTTLRAFDAAWLRRLKSARQS
jgi:peptidoglycan/xylan/chitin deacetylase (PgdA/CDA1 family)